MYDVLKQIGNWPPETAQARKEKLHIHIPPEKSLKLIHGKDHHTRMDIFISNEQNTTGIHTIPGGKFADRVDKLFGGRAGGLLTMGLGDKDTAFRFIDALKMAKNTANLGDAKTLVIHPASTIYHEFDQAQRSKMGVGEDMVRVAVGIEDFEDIQADFQQALTTAVEKVVVKK